MAAVTLVFQKNPIVNIPVTIANPTAEGFVDVQIQLDVGLLPSDDIKLVLDAAAEQGKNSDIALFKKCVKGWQGLGKSEAEALPFTPKNVDAICKNSWFVSPCALAILNAHNGRAEEVEKN